MGGGAGGVVAEEEGEGGDQGEDELGWWEVFQPVESCGLVVAGSGLCVVFEIV